MGDCSVIMWCSSSGFMRSSDSVCASYGGIAKLCDGNVGACRGGGAGDVFASRCDVIRSKRRRSFAFCFSAASGGDGVLLEALVSGVDGG